MKYSDREHITATPTSSISSQLPPPPHQRPRKPSWTAQRLDLMLNDLCDNIRRLSSSSSISLRLVELDENSVSADLDEDQQQQKSKNERDAKEAETLQLILQANHHHSQYASLMERALPIIEKLKSAKEGGFFTSLWALVRGASGKADRVLHLMHRAEIEAEQMQWKWDQAEKLAMELEPANKKKYLKILRDARQMAAKENAHIDARMAQIKNM